MYLPRGRYQSDFEVKKERDEMMRQRDELLKCQEELQREVTQEERKIYLTCIVHLR